MGPSGTGRSAPSGCSSHHRRLASAISLQDKEETVASSSIHGILGMVALALISLPWSNNAHMPHRCPEGFPKTPALPGHLEQADIVSGRLWFHDIVAAGARLFTTAFNIWDGQGRSAAERRQITVMFCDVVDSTTLSRWRGL
jgi:hypothetical protein